MIPADSDVRVHATGSLPEVRFAPVRRAMARWLRADLVG